MSHGVKSLSSTRRKTITILKGGVRGLSDLSRISVIFKNATNLMKAVQVIKAASDGGTFKSDAGDSQPFVVAQEKNKFKRYLDKDNVTDTDPATGYTDDEKTKLDADGWDGYRDINYRFIDLANGCVQERMQYYTSSATTPKHAR